MIKKYAKWFRKSTSKRAVGAESLEKIQLIEGTFNAIDAAEVLLSLVTYKIKFHNLQLLHPQESDGFSRAQSEKRIAELKNAKNRITQIIMEARDKGTLLEINSDIDIKLVSPK